MRRPVDELLAVAARPGYGRDVKARRGAAALMAAAAAAAPASAKDRPAYREKLAALRLPMVQGLRVAYERPEGIPAGTRAEGAGAGGVIYDPQHHLDRHDLAHESFHELDMGKLTDADRAGLQKIMGRFASPGAWDQGEPGDLTARSPAEIAAEWFAAARARIDPRHGWESGYSDIPTRRRLMRFGRAVEQIGRREGLPRYRRPRGPA